MHYDGQRLASSSLNYGFLEKNEPEKIEGYIRKHRRGATQ